MQKKYLILAFSLLMGSCLFFDSSTKNEIKNNDTETFCGTEDEECQGSELNGGTCFSVEDKAFGTLACDDDCTFNVEKCTDHNVKCELLTPELRCDMALGLTCDDFISGTVGIVACNNDCTINIEDCRTCGNNEIDENEECDNNNLNDKTCRSLDDNGKVFGSLKCDATCGFDTSDCRVGFVSVAAGINLVCGLKNDRTVECQGLDGVTENKPDGDFFSEISVSRSFACGILSSTDSRNSEATENNILCWGNGSIIEKGATGGFRHLTGNFIQLSTSDAQSVCGVTMDGEVKCLDNSSAEADGPFVKVDIGAAQSTVCYLTDEGDLSCDASDPFTQDNVSAFSVWENLCYIDSSSRIVCTKLGAIDEINPPDGKDFVDLSVYNYEVCGITSQRSVSCSSLVAPGGKFEHIAVGSTGKLINKFGFACGIQDGFIKCWGTRTSF